MKKQNILKSFRSFTWYGMVVLLIGLTAVSCDSNEKSKIIAPKDLAVKMAESIMERRPDGYGNWNYVTGTVLLGFKQVYEYTGNKKFYNYLKKTIDATVNDDGSIDSYRIKKYNIDQVKTGSVLLYLYEKTGKNKYRVASQMIRKQLDGHPRIKQGGFWHKQIYPNQMWLDGLYMGQPFYAEYAKMFEQSEDFDDIVLQFKLIHENCYDSETGLYRHAWDASKKMFWADKKTGLSHHIWGRGLGWYVMAIVDVLDYLPKNHEGHNILVSQIQGLAETLTRYQDPETGCWWQVMDLPNKEGNYIEGTCTSMFVYGLAKAVRLGYIDEKYFDTVQKGYEGLVNHLIYKDTRDQYNLLRCCAVAGLGGNHTQKIRDGSYEYYCYIEAIIPNDGKGTGPLMGLGIEIAKIKAEM